MNRKLALLAMYILVGFSSGVWAQVDILRDNFSSGSVDVSWVRYRQSYIDSGNWYADQVSEWTIADGQLENNSTNTTTAKISEGGVVNMVSYTNAAFDGVELSFDYDVGEGDTLYVHLWGYDGTVAAGSTEWFINYQFSNGGLGNSASRTPDMVPYSLKDGTSGTALSASSDQALVALTGSGSYSNTISISSLGVSGFNDTADFEYYMLAFTRNEDGTPGTNAVRNVALVALDPPAPPTNPLPANVDFPDQHVIVSQQLETHSAGFSYSSTNAANQTLLGQSFILDANESLGALSIRKADFLSLAETGPHELELWIGEYDSMSDSSNHVAGTTLYTETIDVAGVSFFDDTWYSFNLASNLTLSANTEYAFELTWTTEDASHVFNVDRYKDDLVDPFDKGSLLYTTGIAGALPGASIIDEPMNDMVFALHRAPVATVTSVVADPAEVAMELTSLESTVDGEFSFGFLSDDHLNLALSISDESHLGAFSVLSDTPQLVKNPRPSQSVIEVRFDNSTLALPVGTLVTGLVNVAWSEEGGGDSGILYVPVSTRVIYASGIENSIVSSGANDYWGNPANWELGRVPGALAADKAIIQYERSIDVATNFTGALEWETVIKDNVNGASLNIAADLMNGGTLSLGTDAGYWGYVNQTAGHVGLVDLDVGDHGTAVSNSVYTMSDGTLTVANDVTVLAGGELRVAGGALKARTTGSTTTSALSVNVGGLYETSGGTNDLTGGRLDVDGTFRIVGDDATVLVHQLWAACTGTFDFKLSATGVSPILNDSWGQLQACSFTVDGANYTAGPQEILLYSGGWNSGALGSFAVTNLGVEGVDWEMVEVTGTNVNDPHSITLNILGTPYETWAAGYGLMGNEAQMSANPDGDAVNNLYEYAVGGDPTNKQNVGYVPTGISVAESGHLYFEYVYARRIAYEGELIYTPQFGTDLVFTNWTHEGVVEVPGNATIDENYETVTNRVDISSEPHGFMQLIVEEL